MVDYKDLPYKLKQLVDKTSLEVHRLPYKSRYEVGKTYWNGYWEKWYSVLSAQYRDKCLMEVHIRWEDGKEAKHCTDLNPARDYELRDKTSSVVKEFFEMAYSYKQNENEKREVLGTFEKNKRGDYIQVTAIDNGKGEVSYDIRQMYTNEADELCFTSKGVRMTTEMTGRVLAAILNSIDADTFNEVMAQVETETFVEEEEA